MSNKKYKRLEEYTRYLYKHRQKDRKPKGNKSKKEGGAHGTKNIHI